MSSSELKNNVEIFVGELYKNTKFEKLPNLVPYNKNTSTNRLTVYEKTKLIGMWAEFLNKQYKASDTSGNWIKRCEKDFEEGKIPFKIKRYMPDGSIEIWDYRQMLW